MSATECRHCGEPGIVRVALPHGCVVFPHDDEQWLCAQHYDRLDNTHAIIEDRGLWGRLT